MTAVGAYGSYAWTYDAVGNRTSEQLGSVLSTYGYQTTSNRLATIASATASSAPAMTYQYDPLGRLAKAFQTATPANGGTYAYDARWRLSSRTVAQTATPTSVTVLYVHDQADHIIAELDANGQTQREYIWLDDMPVAVLDGVASGSPTFYYVHVDHLNRPIRMTVQARTRAWEAKYAPFGATTSIVVNPAVMDLRFPGQWFQLETGLAYNWHRHYDATIGRYVQPDPLVVDDGDATVSGLALDMFESIRGKDGDRAAKAFGRKDAVDIAARSHPRAMFRDGPSSYSYARQRPLAYKDPSGLVVGVPYSMPPDPNIRQCMGTLCEKLGKVGDLCIYFCPDEGNRIVRIYSPLGLSCPNFAVTSNPNVKPW